MEKMKTTKEKIVLFEITNLVLAIVAFSFLIGQIGFVGASPSPKADNLFDRTSVGSDGFTGGPSSTQTPSAGAGIRLTGAGGLEGATRFKVPSELFHNGKAVTEVVGYNGKHYLPSLVGDPKGVVDLAGSNIDPSKLTEITAASKATQSAAAGMLGLTKGSGFSAIVGGLQWGLIVGSLGYMVGGFIGFNDNNKKALAIALGAGAFVWQGLQGWDYAHKTMIMGGKSLADLALPIGIITAVVIFVMMYKTEEWETVTFQCMPWQAPNGGGDCEECNDPKLPCSEYRCKSLGQSCELLNKGTGKESCVSVNPKDVDPPIIRPDENKLTVGYKYVDVKIMPPGPGFKIKPNAEDCIPPFTPIEFGINTNEPAQCKIDFNHTSHFENMRYWFGSTNLYLYNHSERFSLPGPGNLEGENVTIGGDGQWNWFVRCKDKNGNVNEAEYAIRFCIDPSPDMTPPQVKGTSIAPGSGIPADTDSAVVDFYINEPSECKWSTEDQSYDVMANEMTCATEIYQMNAMQLYPCRTNLTGIPRNEVTFYIRCKDQPNKEENDRNVNRQSYVYTLTGSTALKMKDLKPEGTIFGSVSPAPVELRAETLFGINNGKAICYYSTSGAEGDYIKFFDTDTDDGVHTQRQDLVGGNYIYHYKCVDAAGNVARNSTSFTLEIDTAAPVIARVYEESEMLKVVTVRNSECAYTTDDDIGCDFAISEGTEMPYSNTTSHVAEWKEDKTYYVKCRDEFKNEEVDCSVIVRPTGNFL